MLPVAILAGGLATRLRPLTETIPKALVEVNGEPFIAHQLRLLRANGIERVVVCTGYLGEMIQERVGDGASFGLQLEFAYDGPRLLGTAGALKQALPALGQAFFVLYGDSYLPCDYRAVQAAFARSGKPALMTVFHNQGRWDTSNIEYVKGCLVAYNKFHPTPRMQYIDYGLGIFSSSAFALVPESQSYDLAVLYQELLSTGDLAACEVGQRFYEIGSFAGLAETQRYLTAHPAPGASLLPRDQVGVR
ncbi:MAG: nucleotidyltransferase family protein [Deltaproteobacteria bacterium]|nr:nucleotidyltransferase family protein [Deltaproteobacteria bacterium]